MAREIFKLMAYGRKLRELYGIYEKRAHGTDLVPESRNSNALHVILLSKKSAADQLDAIRAATSKSGRGGIALMPNDNDIASVLDLPTNLRGLLIRET